MKCMLAFGPKSSSDMWKSSRDNSTSFVVRLGDRVVRFGEQRDDFSCVKLHSVGVFFSFRGMRSVTGVGLFAAALSVNLEVTANRKLVRRGLSLFFTVLKAKGEAALNKSCVLIGGPRSALPAPKSPKESSK